MKSHFGTWSTPLGSPLVPPFPFAFRDVEVLTLAYRTRTEAIAEFIPPPLQPKGDWVLIHLYNMNDVEWLGSYGECNVMVEAELPGKARGGYSPFLFLNSDGGLAQGREVHGQPKKWANPRVEFRGDLIVGILERNGIDVVTGTMAYKQQRGSLEQLKRDTFDFGANINYKIVQHINGQTAVRQLTARQLVNLKIFECWHGPCSVELRANVQAPIYRLPIIETADAYFWRADFALSAGEIIHDYLR